MKKLTKGIVPSLAYENYPFRMVVISNLLTLAVYFLGAAIMLRLSIIALAAYLCYIGLLELRLMRGHCVNCYYFGKMCSFGRGKFSCLFFKKGNPEKFIRILTTWKCMIPDMLVSLVPILAAIALLLRSFEPKLCIRCVGQGERGRGFFD
jgi:hypothetical protein